MSYGGARPKAFNLHSPQQHGAKHDLLPNMFQSVHVPTTSQATARVNDTRRQNEPKNNREDVDTAKHVLGLLCEGKMMSTYHSCDSEIKLFDGNPK